MGLQRPTEFSWTECTLRKFLHPAAHAYNVLHMHEGCRNLHSVHSVQLNSAYLYVSTSSLMYICSSSSSSSLTVLPLICQPSHVSASHLPLVPRVFGGSIFDKAILHNPVSILHPFTIILNGFYTPYLGGKYYYRG